MSSFPTLFSGAFLSSVLSFSLNKTIFHAAAFVFCIIGTTIFAALCSSPTAFASQHVGAEQQIPQYFTTQHYCTSISCNTKNPPSASLSTGSRFISTALLGTGCKRRKYLKNIHLPKISYKHHQALVTSNKSEDCDPNASGQSSQDFYQMIKIVYQQ